MNDLASAVVNVANDSIAIYDADAGVTSKEAISDLMLAVAGGGINSVAGVLSVNIDDSSIEDNAGQLRVKALGITDGMLAGSISDAKMASDYVQTSEVDDASIEFTGGTLNVKANGVSNTMLAGGIATSKLALRTEITTLSPDGNTSAFDLDDALSANTELVLCFRNGLCITQVASSPSDEDSFTISPTGGTGGVALITFGANISASDSVKVF